MNQKQLHIKTANYKVKQESSNSASNNLVLLKKLNGKYPYEVKLFENSVFTLRLKKILGNNRYNFLTETWAVETPMEFANNIFVASDWQAHNCGSKNFIIVVDFSKNLMFVGIREEDQVNQYLDDGSNSLKLREWANGNLRYNIVSRATL